MGDLLAASRDLRSFDKEDAESDAGKARAQKLVKDYFADYAQNAAVAPDETDMFGTPPPTREEMMRHFRENGRDAGPRFSVIVNPHLKDDVEAALVTYSNGGENAKPLSRRQDVVMSENLPLFGAVGLPDMKVVCDPAHLRKINNEHLLTLDQIVELPTRYNDPAVVFKDGDRAFVVVTDMVAPNKAGDEKRENVGTLQKPGSIEL